MRLPAIAGPKGRLYNRTGEACPEQCEGTTPTRT
jgi:hypothetical protein